MGEEVFFFIIQTYNTSLLYLLLSKPVFHPAYLPSQKHHATRWNLGHAVLAFLVTGGGFLVWRGNEGTYLGLILAWAGPFALLLWSLSSHFLLNLPLSSTVAPIAIPTIYLWVVDTLALKRGTWTIESGTKFGVHLWDGLEIEEAVFFLATNILIVFGLVAFDHALAILLTFPKLFPQVPELPSPFMLIDALLTGVSTLPAQHSLGDFELTSFYFTPSAELLMILLTTRALRRRPGNGLPNLHTTWTKPMNQRKLG